MDSVTQAVLGAVVADACLGKQLGRKAAWWGLALGTLPDLDILFMPLFDAASALAWHRGISHSLLIVVLATPLLAWLLRWIHGSQISWQRGCIATSLIWLTHVLIDAVTVYGTGLLEPFSSDWIEWNLFFIIDPLYTLPLLIATLAALIFSISRSWRPRMTTLALVLSSAYVVWAMTAKTIINQRFVTEMAVAGIEADRWQSAPAPLNTFFGAV